MKRLDEYHEFETLNIENNELIEVFNSIYREQQSLALSLKNFESEINRCKNMLDLIAEKKEELLVQEENIKIDIVSLQEKISTASSQYEKLKKPSEELVSQIGIRKARMQEILDNAIYILIHSFEIGSEENRKSYQFYYVPNLDTNIVLNEDNIRKNAVDFRDFFKDYGFSSTSITLNNQLLIRSRNVMKTIISDLFSKKNYSSWDEVLLDVIDIPYYYDRPLSSESAIKYIQRTNIKGKEKTLQKK